MDFKLYEFSYSVLSSFDHKDNHNSRNTTEWREDSSFFGCILTDESDLQAQFAANHSNHTALTALIRLTFLFGW